MAREWPKFLILMGNEGGISKHTHTMEMDQIEGGRERCVRFTLPNNLNELYWVCFICPKFDAEWLLPCCGGQCVCLSCRFLPKPCPCGVQAVNVIVQSHLQAAVPTPPVPAAAKPSSLMPVWKPRGSAQSIFLIQEHCLFPLAVTGFSNFDDNLTEFLICNVKMTSVFYNQLICSAHFFFKAGVGTFMCLSAHVCVCAVVHESVNNRLWV